MIGKHETRPQLTHRIAVLGGDLLVKVLEAYDDYEGRALPQDNVGVSYAPAVNKSYAFLDFNKQSGDEIYNLWRGIGDIIKLRARWKPTNTTTRFAMCIPPEAIQDLNLDSKYPNTPPGGVVFVKAGKGRSYLCISCRSGWVALTGIYYGGRKKMEARDFANGFIHPGAEHLFIKDS
ncbi:methionyl-tRNA formyltransferase, mitochondrial isoform X2 [Eurytemora carolleeae]|nr:methionyl-tRNA formyltransferase, mitochondrial isoform X2 [Eurytemora carolleeae]|eukprot:XP_023347380.1 methionyl-tRNA formyltransferase, mitochondrial-like isoform X2 [Eurytemora affinis]